MLLFLSIVISMSTAKKTFSIVYFMSTPARYRKVIQAKSPCRKRRQERQRQPEKKIVLHAHKRPKLHLRPNAMLACRTRICLPSLKASATTRSLLLISPIKLSQSEKEDVWRHLFSTLKVSAHMYHSTTAQTTSSFHLGLFFLDGLYILCDVQEANVPKHVRALVRKQSQPAAAFRWNTSGPKPTPSRTFMSRSCSTVTKQPGQKPHDKIGIMYTEVHAHKWSTILQTCSNIYCGLRLQLFLFISLDCRWQGKSPVPPTQYLSKPICQCRRQPSGRPKEDSDGRR